MDKLAMHGGRPVRTRPLPDWPQMGPEEHEHVSDVLRSNRLSLLAGTKVAQFEKEFAAKMGRRYGVATNSGTTAIHLALAALDLGPGDEVITTPHTFVGTATPIIHQNAVPVFADIDPRTFNLDPASVRTKITERTKAIVPVHLNGHPADMDAFNAIGEEFGIAILEDAAQAHGARYKGRPAGSLTPMAAFSFWEDKILTTGEGGAVVTDDAELYTKLRMIRNHGEEPEEEGYYAGERMYMHLRIGYNHRMSELSGAVGLAQVRRLEAYVEARRKAAHGLTERFDRIPEITPPYEAPDVEHAFYKYIVMVDTSQLSCDLVEFITAVREEGIPVSRRYWTPIHMQPFLQQRSYTGCSYSCPSYAGSPEYREGTLPNAETLPKTMVRIGVNPALEEQDLDDIVAAFEKVVLAHRQ